MLQSTEFAIYKRARPDCTLALVLYHKYKTAHARTFLLTYTPIYTFCDYALVITFISINIFKLKVIKKARVLRVKVEATRRCCTDVSDA